MPYRSSPTGPIEAVYRYAGATVRAISDPLEVAYRQQVCRQVNDSLCKLYVAMTRAKHALHMIVEPLKRNKNGKIASDGWTTPSYAAVLRRALSQWGEAEGFDGQETLYQHGDPQWARPTINVYLSHDGRPAVIRRDSIAKYCVFACVCFIYRLTTHDSSVMVTG